MREARRDFARAFPCRPEKYRTERPLYLRGSLAVAIRQEEEG